MRSEMPAYPDQFQMTQDLLQVLIPREDIVVEITARGEHQVVSDVCWAVALVADTIACAQSLS